MLAEQQDAPIAYNLRSKSKITGLPAVTSVSVSEPTAATPKPGVIFQRLR